MYFLSTNDKTVKFWKIYENDIKSITPYKFCLEEGELKLPKVKITEKTWEPSLKRSFTNLHDYHIHSLGIAPNGENFLSADDLRIYLWNLETEQTAFKLIDLKPDVFNDLDEVIIRAKFHPTQDNTFMYCTSKGKISLCDLRQNSKGKNSAITYQYKKEEHKDIILFDIVESISDISFESSGRYIISRDFLQLKIWDIAKTDRPVVSSYICKPLKSNLLQLYENEGIFEKFSLDVSPCGNFTITGMFDSTFHIIENFGEGNKQFRLNFEKKNQILDMGEAPQKISKGFDFGKKVLKVGWNPVRNSVAVANINSLHLFNTEVKEDVR